MADGLYQDGVGESATPIEPVNEALSEPALVQLAQAGAQPLVLTKPPAGQSSGPHTVVPGQDIVTDFPTEAADVSMDGPRLIITFEDGARIEVANFGAVDPVPNLILEDGTILAGGVVVAQLGAIEQPLDFETVGGPEVLGGGVHEYSDDLGSVIAMLSPEGTIPLTVLAATAAAAEEPPPDDILPEEVETPLFPPQADNVLTPAEDGSPPQELLDALAEAFGLGGGDADTSTNGGDSTAGAGILAVTAAETFAVTASDNGNALVDTILGSGITIVGPISYIGSETSSGFFEGGLAAGIGIESGIILTSGSVTNALGPNDADGTTTNNNLAGDPDLTAIAGVNTFDATVLEFDFLSDGGDLFFNFVFASEEYNEFANGGVNDSFGFFLDGVNVALIPGTNTPISINTVNGGNPFGTNEQNSEFFNNNDTSDGGPFFNIEYDGFTDTFTVAVTGLAPGEHHIKLAIADGGDRILDSAVFIQAGSFSDVPGGIEQLPEIAFWKQLTVDGVIGDSDIPQADFGGLDAETPLSALTFTLLSDPAFGQLILDPGDGSPATVLSVGETFTAADTVWWVASQSDVDAFLETNPEIGGALPDVIFNYSVTDSDGLSANETVTITFPSGPPQADNVLTPAEQGSPPQELLDALAEAGFGASVTESALYAVDNNNAGYRSIIKIGLDGSVSVAVTNAEIAAAIEAAVGTTDFVFNLDESGVAVDAAGNIFFTTDEVEIVEGPTVEFVLVKPAGGGAVRVVATTPDVGDPEGIVIGPDGTLYVADGSLDGIVKITDPLGTPVVSILTPESAFLAVPGIDSVDLDAGIAISSDGATLYVTSNEQVDEGSGPNAVFAVDAATGAVNWVATSPDFSDLLFITVAPDGSIIVMDEGGADAVHRISSDGSTVTTFLTNAQIQAANGGAIPDLEGGATFDADGNFYLTEEITDTILKWNAGAALGTIDTNSGGLFVAEETIAAASVGAANDPDLEGDMTFAAVPADDGEVDIAFWKELTVDGVIGDSDNPQADFGGLDAETPLSALTFTLLGDPAFGVLIHDPGDGSPATVLSVGDTFTSADTVWWVATQSDVDAFLEANSEFDGILPDVTFDYSVTDGDGNVAEAPVVITLPDIPPPEAQVTIGPELDPLIVKEDSALHGGSSMTESNSVYEANSIYDEYTGEPHTDNAINLSAIATDGVLTTIVIEGLDPSWTYDFSGLENSGAVLSDSDFSDGNIVIDLTGLGLTSYDGCFIVAPPEDSDVDPGTITATANVVSPLNPALTASDSETVDIVVDAVLDDFADVSSSPVEDGTESASEQTIGLGLTLSFSNAGFPGSGSGGTDTDGSELYTVVLTLNSALPEGAALSTTDGTATITPTIATVYEITGPNLSTAVGGLQVTVPPSFEGTVSGAISTVSIEANTPPELTELGSGDEPFTFDNKVVDSASFSVNIADGADPSAEPIDLTVDEKDLDTVLDVDDLQIGTTTGTINTASPDETDSGTLVFSAGSDAITSILFGATASIVVKDEYGTPISVLWSGTGTGPLVGTLGGVTVIVLALSGDTTAVAGGTANVDVTATLTDAFPHADGLSGNVTITGVDVQATNSDGDTGSGIVNVTVLDDAPTAADDWDKVAASAATDGNVITGDDANDPDGTPDLSEADTFGADGAHSAGGVTDVDGTQVLADNTPVAGSLGDLTIDPDGDYTYVADANVLGTDTFPYTITDGDGDTSSATLAIAVGGLIVGSNEDDDVVDGNEPHEVPNLAGDLSGTIQGGAGDDTLVGDPGGVTTGNLNVAITIDISQSMDTEVPDLGGATRLDVVKDAVTKLLTQLAGHSGTVNLYVQTFATDGHDPLFVGVFTMADLANLVVDIDDLEVRIRSQKYTNYAVPLADAEDWFVDQVAATEGFTNVEFFLSDGLPNTIDPSNPFQNNLGLSLAEKQAAALAAARIAAADMIDQNTGTLMGDDRVLVNAVGMGGATLASLSQIDNTEVVAAGPPQIGEAQIVDLSSEGALEAALLNSLPFDVGADVINGEAGDDVIFGDVPNTDALLTTVNDALVADSQAPLALQPGSGWFVFDALEGTSPPGLDPAGDGAIWTRADTIAYLRNNVAELSADGRGEADEIDGGAGDDIIVGQAGDDDITGGPGADTFVYGFNSDSSDVGVDGSDTIDMTTDDTLRFDDLVDGVTTIAGLDNIVMVAEGVTDTTIAFKDGSATITLAGVTSGMGPMFDSLAALDLAGYNIEVVS